MKSWLEDNGIKMHSTDNEKKTVVAARFIRTFRNKIYKYMTSVSKKLANDVTNLANKLT